MRRPSLKYRIYGAFLSIGVIFLVLIIYTLYVKGLLLNELIKQNNAISEATELLIIERDAIDLHRRVNIYITTGRTSDEKSVLGLTQRLLLTIKELNEHHFDRSSIHEKLDRMLHHLRKYQEAFLRLARERELRQQYLDDQIPELSAAIRTSLSLLGGSSQKGNQRRSEVNEVMRLFAEVEKILLRYLSEPSVSKAHELSLVFIEIERVLDGLKSTENLFSISELIGLVAEYERIAFRTIQATRTYLYSRNVVMAGHAYEFGYMSNQLKSEFKDRADKFMIQTERFVVTQKQLLIALSVATTGIALFVSLYLVRLIVTPIEQLTGTFRSLVEGGLIEQIPGTERADELGEMARAADVFRTVNEETTRLAKELEEKNADLDSFAYVASHDLKAPLLGISRLSSWIEEDLGDSIPDESKMHLNKMKSRISKMEDLLKGLFDYSRIGRVHISPEEVSPEDLIKEVTELLGVPESDRIIIEGSLPNLYTERAALLQVFLNLISNAIKYNQRDDGQVRIASRIVKSMVEFSIADNGDGIPDKYHEQVFLMYKRCHTDESIEGSGMGLAMIKKEIERRGGVVYIDPEYESGARFVFTWPLRSQNEKIEERKQGVAL